MKNLDLCIYGTKEMSASEMESKTGGFWGEFVAGALVGGIIYDVYKSACLWMIKQQIEHPEYWEGVPHGR
jgi:hypothetical protein